MVAFLRVECNDAGGYFIQQWLKGGRQGICFIGIFTKADICARHCVKYFTFFSSSILQ